MVLRSHKALAISGVFLLLGCASEGGVFDTQSYDFIDRGKELNRDDYENMALPKGAKPGEVVNTAEVRPASMPPVPEIAQILAAPRPPKIGKTKLVSVAVTSDVPLTDVILELARLADVDVELGAGIEGGISFRAKDRPFNEVIERISSLAGLRYTMKNGVLRMERDVPYVKNYQLDFLNVVRSSTSQITSATDVLSASTAGGGSGGDSGGSGGGSSGGSSGGSGGSSGGSGGFSSGTSSSISSTSESDFWNGLQSSLSEILNYVPVDSVYAQSQNAQNAGGVGMAGGDAMGGSTGGSASGGSGRGQFGAFFVINRQAGILSVSASQRQHELVSEYLKMLERNASAQVLIEAKIVEVTLEKGYQSGVNWSAMIGNSDFNFAYPTTMANGATYSILGPGIDSDGIGAANPTGDNNLGINLDAVIQLTERFGVSRTLSSPRLHAINNQQAILTFAENRIFFDITCERTEATSIDGVFIPGVVTINSEPRSVPIGIIMNLMPSVNMDTNEITLSVRPTLSRQVGSVADPGVVCATGTGNTIVNDIPIVEVRELDSVMKLKSGNVMVIGGLMEDVMQSTDEGLPYASSIPFLGNAFKSTSHQSQKKELIIFIKASIVHSNGSYQPADKTVYDKFTTDPRPLKLD